MASVAQSLCCLFLAGSRFWQGGSFEVIKSTSSTSDTAEGSLANKSTLEVIIPSELDGSAYVQVEVKSVPGRRILLFCASLTDTNGPTADSMTLTCSTCNRQFRARISLLSHQRTHQHTRTYSRNNDGLSH